jgi:hypothetical protein
MPDVVENLWTDGANPVENLTRKIFFCADPLKTLLAAVCWTVFATRFA